MFLNKSKSLFLLITFLSMSVSALSQFKYSEIPIIKIEDFQGKRTEQSKYKAYTTSRVYYRIDSVREISENKFRVLIKTKVEMNKESSYFDTSGVNQDVLTKLLNHEQGHIYLAYIAANRLEKEISKLTFTRKFVEEVRKKFHELNAVFGKDDLLYDKETKHSANEKAQQYWDEKFRKDLKYHL